MNNNNTARLYLDFTFKKHSLVKIIGNDFHYLVNVMRCKIGQNIYLFNNYQGEYVAQICHIDKKYMELNILEQTRIYYPPKQNISIIFALIKLSRLKVMIEKTTELGITNFIPVTTNYSVVDKLNINKAKIWIKEAVEQSNRLHLPNISAPVKLENLLLNWSKDRHIILCNNFGSKQNLLDMIAKLKNHSSINYIIGPEGGFSQDEVNKILDYTFVKPCNIGDFILRSETAAITMCALINQLGN